MQSKTQQVQLQILGTAVDTDEVCRANYLYSAKFAAVQYLHKLVGDIYTRLTEDVIDA